MDDATGKPVVIVAATSEQMPLYRGVFESSTEMLAVSTVDAAIAAYNDNAAAKAALVNCCLEDGDLGSDLVIRLRELGFEGKIVMRACTVTCCNKLAPMDIPAYDNHLVAAHVIRDHVLS